MWTDTPKGRSSVCYKRSLDGGGRWSGARRLSAKRGGAVFPARALVGRELHVVWQDFTNGQIFYRGSTRGGSGFGRRVRLSVGGVDAAFPCVAAAGRGVFVVWSDGAAGGREIFFRESADAGSGWGPVDQVSSPSGFSGTPWIATAGGDLHAVWVSSLQILHRTRRAGEESWGAEEQLTATAGQSQFPSLVAIGSRVHVVFEDPSTGAKQIFYRRLD